MMLVAMAILIGALAIAAALWQIGEQFKGRNAIDVMRLEFQVRQAGWTDVQWQQFIDRGIKAFRS